jgi:hypothetical protein
LKTPGWQTWPEKMSKSKFIKVTSFGKIQSTAFDQTNWPFSLFEKVLFYQSLQL